MENGVSSEILAAREKLKASMSSSRQIGGKGSARRKIKKTNKSGLSIEKRLEFIIRKIGASKFGDIEELAIFCSDDKYIDFKKPHLAASVQSNTYIITGTAVEKIIDKNEILKEVKGLVNLRKNMNENNKINETEKKEKKKENIEKKTKEKIKENKDVNFEDVANN